MKRLVLIMLWGLASTAGLAQGSNTVKSDDDINAIKRDTTYIYAETTMRDPVEALSGARAILELKVIDWVRSKFPAENVDTCVTKAKEEWFSLNSHRGKYNRVLVYVKKDSIIPRAEQPEVVEATVADSVAVDTVAIEDVVNVPTLSSEEQEMASIVNFNAIEPYVNSLKNEGRIKAYGKYASLPEETLCYIFVYDKEGSVVATLRQTEDGQHFNLRTLSDDNVKNYKNCGAIWLQLK